MNRLKLNLEIKFHVMLSKNEFLKREMKYLDCVEVIVEKEDYAKHGVHKGMQGVIWSEECIDSEWDVYFSQYGDKPDIAEISIKEEDLMLLPNGMDARINEKIKARFGD